MENENASACHLSVSPALQSDRQHLSYDICLEVKSEDYQNFLVLCCVQHLCTMMCRRVSISYRLTVSQKVSPVWFAITLAYINGFLQFLAEVSEKSSQKMFHFSMRLFYLAAPLLVWRSTVMALGISTNFSKEVMYVGPCLSAEKPKVIVFTWNVIQNLLSDWHNDVDGICSIFCMYFHLAYCCWFLDGLLTHR